jgi:hypothetical protein
MRHLKQQPKKEFVTCLGNCDTCTIYPDCLIEDKA